MTQLARRQPSSTGAPVLAGILEELDRRRTRERRRRAILAVSAQIALAVALIVAWQRLSGDPRAGGFVLIDKFYVSNPSEVVATLIRWFAEGEIYRHIGVTAMETIIGFGIGATAGLVLGLALGASDFMGRVLSPFIIAAYSVPRLALVPLFVLWFGIGLPSKLVFVAMVVFFLVFFSTFNGVREVSRDLVNILRVMQARPLDLMMKVTVPSAMTWMLSGLRVSVPYALVAAVTAEIVSSNQGLGYLLIRSSNQFYVQGVFAAILLMVALSLALMSVVVLVERWLLRWKRP